MDSVDRIPIQFPRTLEWSKEFKAPKDNRGGLEILASLHGLQPDISGRHSDFPAV